MWKIIQKEKMGLYLRLKEVSFIEIRCYRGSYIDRVEALIIRDKGSNNGQLYKNKEL